MSPKGFEEEKVVLKQVCHNGKVRAKEMSYSVLRLQDQGTFGSVYRIRSQGLQSSKNESLLAMKVLSIQNRGLHRELKVLKKLSHPHIIKLIGYFWDESSLKLIFPLCHSNLYSTLESGGPLPRSDALKIVHQLFDALVYLHSRSICHRDIKPKNILLSDPPETYNIKICDFGSALLMEDSPLRPLNSYICSRYYRAPELLLGCNFYDYKVDVWSAATVWVEMLLGEPLFWGETTGDQIIEIVRVMGLPSTKDLEDMSLTTSMLPVLKMIFERLESKNLQTIMQPFFASKKDFDFLCGLLSYSPVKRLSSYEALECMESF